MFYRHCDKFDLDSRIFKKRELVDIGRVHFLVGRVAMIGLSNLKKLSQCTVSFILSANSRYVAESIVSRCLWDYKMLLP